MRRHLAAGAPLVVVRDGRRADRRHRRGADDSAVDVARGRLGRRLPGATPSPLLAAVARAATARDARAYLAGGVVRDALAVGAERLTSSSRRTSTSSSKAMGPAWRARWRRPSAHRSSSTRAS